MRKSGKTNVRAKDIFSIYAREALSHPRLFFFIILGGIGVQVADLVYPLYLRELFNLLATETPTETALGGLLVIVGIIGAVQLVGWAFRRLQTYSVMNLESRGMASLYSRAFDYLIGHSYRFFISNFSGTLVRRVSKFARAFEVMVDSIIFQFLPTAIFVIGAITILFLRSYVLGIALAAWVFFFVLFQFFIARWRHPLRVARAEADSKITGTLSDSISNQNTVVLFSGAVHEHKILRRVARFWQKATMRSWNADELMWSIQGFLMVGINIGLLYGAVIYWGRGLLTIGDLALIQTYLLGIFSRLMHLNREVRRFYDGYADATEMMELLQTPHEIQDAPKALPLDIQTSEITFSSVSFSFEDRNPILKNFALRIKGGEKVALVGPSGAGKTTVFSLLLRFYDPEAGAVRFDGRDLRALDPAALRAHIGLVSQEPVIFSANALENIRYGRPEASDEEVRAAAEAAAATEFLDRLPEGFDTFLGERGLRLSGGQRQRIAIARAILRDPALLLLDEATSALDAESERLVQDALGRLMEGRTSIVIAHRLATVQKADRILVMDQGHIVATGSHDALIAQGGLYARLAALQFDQPASADAAPERAAL